MDDSHKFQGDEDLPSLLHEEDEGLKEDGRDRSKDPDHAAASWQISRLPHAPNEAKEQEKASGKGPDLPVLKGSKEHGSLDRPGLPLGPLHRLGQQLSHVPTQLLHTQLNLLMHIATLEVNSQTDDSHKRHGDEDLSSHFHEEDEGLKGDNKDRSKDPDHAAAPWQILRLPEAPNEAKEQHIAMREVNSQKDHSDQCQGDEDHPSHSR